MKDIKDVLLYLDGFDENNMFDFDHNNKLYYVSEVLKFIMYDRIEKYDSIDYDDDDEWNILSEDSDTGEIIGFRNM